LEARTASPAAAAPSGENIIRTLPILVVHAHSACNCRCLMCDIWKIREAKSFGVRDLRPQLESIRRLGVRWIVFSGGEPLLNADLPEVCAMLRAEGIHLTLLSTGLLLKKQARSIAASFDDVIVSLDGPRQIHDQIRRVDGAFDSINEGVAALRQLRPGMKIAARSTVQRVNHRFLVETARAAFRMKLDGISFLAVDVNSTAFNRSLVWPLARQNEIALSLDDVPFLDREIDALILAAKAEFPVGFVAESAEKLRRIARHFRVLLGVARPESPICNAPWVSAVVEVDGTVRPCFFHPAIGNLNQETLEEVVNGSVAQDFRKDLEVESNAICKNCVCSLNYRA